MFLIMIGALSSKNLLIWFSLSMLRSSLDEKKIIKSYVFKEYKMHVGVSLYTPTKKVTFTIFWRKIFVIFWQYLSLWLSEIKKDCWKRTMENKIQIYFQHHSDQGYPHNQTHNQPHSPRELIGQHSCFILQTVSPAHNAWLQWSMWIHNFHFEMDNWKMQISNEQARWEFTLVFFGYLNGAPTSS